MNHEPVSEEVVILFEDFNVKGLFDPRIADAHDLFQARASRNLLPPPIPSVMSRMLGWRHRGEIRQRIVERVFVDVMNVMGLWIEEREPRRIPSPKPCDEVVVGKLIQ